MKLSFEGSTVSFVTQLGRATQGAVFVPKGADVVREDELESVPGPGLKSG
jgi:hypothetical protein